VNREMLVTSLWRWRRLCVVLLLVVLAGCGTTISKQSIPTAIEDVPRITAAEVKAMLDRGDDLLIIDTRSLGEYDAGHIAGAISLPLTEIAARHTELPDDTLLVLYCT
jgi:3-mercaptopyruvate sulfurtransferase SseA